MQNNLETILLTITIIVIVFQIILIIKTKHKNKLIKARVDYLEGRVNTLEPRNQDLISERMVLENTIKDLSTQIIDLISENPDKIIYEFNTSTKQQVQVLDAEQIPNDATDIIIFYGYSENKRFYIPELHNNREEKINVLIETFIKIHKNNKLFMSELIKYLKDNLK